MATFLMNINLLNTYSHTPPNSYIQPFRNRKGPSINYVGRRGKGGLAICLYYYISLCSKLADGGGRGQKMAKSCLRSLWMVPSSLFGASGIAHSIRISDCSSVRRNMLYQISYVSQCILTFEINPTAVFVYL